MPSASQSTYKGALLEGMQPEAVCQSQDGPNSIHPAQASTEGGAIAQSRIPPEEVRPTLLFFRGKCTPLKYSWKDNADNLGKLMRFHVRAAASLMQTRRLRSGMPCSRTLAPWAPVLCSSPQAGLFTQVDSSWP